MAQAEPAAEALERARAQPDAPPVLLRAAQALRRAGDDAGSLTLLERIVWLGDVDPASTEAAITLLADRSPAWRGRMLVPVRAFADESVRASTDWQTRLRSIVHALSETLGDTLEVRFVLRALESFDSGAVPGDLAAVHRAFTRATTPAPGDGILLAFTARATPPAEGDSRDGIAEFLGRRASIRLTKDADPRWTAAHEVLHLYGGVHVGHDRDSLMNPTGDSTALDEANRRCVRAMRRRRFERDSGDRGAVDRDVLARIDLHEAALAYTELVAANRTYQRIAAGKVVARDAALADAARAIAGILLGAGRNSDALALFDAAETLYGPDTERGRETALLARSLRAAPTP